MKVILKNILYLFKRFKFSFIFSILGLAVAFSSFIFLVSQIKSDLLYNSELSGCEKIYRLEFIESGTPYALISRPILRTFLSSSSLITSSCEITSYNPERIIYTQEDGVRKGYKEIISYVSPNFFDFFKLDIVNGVISSFDNSNAIAIPLSLSKKMFGDENAINKNIFYENEIWTVVLVYNDLPNNCSVKNTIYKLILDKDTDSWENFYYNGYVQIDDRNNIHNIISSFEQKHSNELSSTLSTVTNISFRLTSLKEIHFVNDVQYDSNDKSSKNTIYLLSTIALIILLVSFINYANFSISIIPFRIKTVNIQKVLGIDYIKLRFFLLCESVIISIVAFLL